MLTIEILLPAAMKEQGEEDAGHGVIRNREAASEFVAIAAHDLREPLRGINASAGLLAELYGHTADESTGRCLQYLRDGIDRMESLINDVAEYCEEELRELDPQEIDLEAVLRDAQGQLSDELKRNEAVITHDPLPSVQSDFAGLAAVFRNLIGNACKFRAIAPPRIHIGAKQ